MTLEHLLYLQQKYPRVVFKHINDNIVGYIQDDTIRIVQSPQWNDRFMVACYYHYKTNANSNGMMQQLSFFALTTSVDIGLAEEILQHVKDTEILFV